MVRPLCNCHNQPMYRNGVVEGRQMWVCKVKKDEAVRAWDSTNLAWKNVYRRKRALLKSITHKKQLIHELEASLGGACE